MTDYLTNDTDLTSVANAIRVKAEISGSLEFPDGFITAINSITGGGMTVTRTQDASGGEVLTITGEATEIEPLSVTANGTYTAPSGTAYSPVTVNVPTGGGTTVTVGITSYDAQHQIAYVDSSGVFHLTAEDVGAGTLVWSDEVIEGSMVVVFYPTGPSLPIDLSNLTLSNSLSLGSRASYTKADFYIAG